MIPLAAIVLASALAHSSHQQLNDSRDGLRASARATPTCKALPCGDTCAFPVTVVTKTRRATFAIESYMKTLTDVRVVGPREIVLIGSWNEYASVVTIVDGRNGHVISNVFAYFPTVSPNGRYLVFVHFFPEHFVTEQESNNRVEFYDFRTPVAGSALRSNEILGTVIYPPEPVEAYHSVQGNADWLDENTFTFDDLVDGRETYRVTVTLREDVASVAKILTHRAAR